MKGLISMETLTRAQIDPIGTMKIKSDAPATRFFEGLGSFVTFEPEEGGHSTIDAVVVSREEIQALAEMTKLLANPEFPAATDVKHYVEERVGYDVDWGQIANRYEQVKNER